MRRPDVAVYCPPFDERATFSRAPRLVAEVLSGSTEAVDRFVKLDEYKDIPSLDDIVLATPDTVAIGFWSRGGDRHWRHGTIGDLAAILPLPSLGIDLAVRDIYDRVAIRQPAGPRLVWPEDDAEP